MTAAWAATPFGLIALPAGAESDLLHLDQAPIVESDTVVHMELPGLDEPSLNAVVENILRRGYLDKPGIRGKDEAVLFVLVNEVLTELEGLRHKLEEEDAG